jgi:hypothetical protein
VEDCRIDAAFGNDAPNREIRDPVVLSGGPD